MSDREYQVKAVAEFILDMTRIQRELTTFERKHGELHNEVISLNMDVVEQIELMEKRLKAWTLRQIKGSQKKRRRK